jgi:hypothetical protein
VEASGGTSLVEANRGNHSKFATRERAAVGTKLLFVEFTPLRDRVTDVRAVYGLAVQALVQKFLLQMSGSP